MMVEKEVSMVVAIVVILLVVKLMVVIAAHIVTTRTPGQLDARSPHINLSSIHLALLFLPHLCCRRQD